MEHTSQVDIWLFPLDAAVTSHQFEILSRSERDRAERFRFEQHRRAYITAHVTLRQILATYLACAPSTIRVQARDGGKPFLPDTPSLGFNLSHTDGLAAVAVGRDTSIGIDVEKIREMEPPYAPLIGARDAEEVSAAPSELRWDNFFRCWTRKEALMKAVGLGLVDDLDAISVGVGEPCHVTSRHPQITPDDWRVMDIAVPSGYSGAFATSSFNPIVSFRSP